MNQHPSSNSGFIVPRAILASLLFASAGLLSFASLAGLTPSLGSASSAVVTQTQPPFTPIENKVSVGGLNLLAKVLATAGKAKPGETFPIVLSYRAGAAPVTNATITVTLHNASLFLTSVPAANSGNV